MGWPSGSSMTPVCVICFYFIFFLTETHNQTPLIAQDRAQRRSKKPLKALMSTNCSKPEVALVRVKLQVLLVKACFQLLLEKVLLEAEVPLEKVPLEVVLIHHLEATAVQAHLEVQEEVQVHHLGATAAEAAVLDQVVGAEGVDVLVSFQIKSEASTIQIDKSLQINLLLTYNIKYIDSINYRLV